MISQIQPKKISSLFQNFLILKERIDWQSFFIKKISSKEEILFDCSKYELQFSAPNIVENVALKLFIYSIYEEEVIIFL